MLPFPRMLQYSNNAPVLPKIAYNFSSGVAINVGQISGTLSGLNFYPIPNSGGLYGIYGTNAALTLPYDVALGLGDYSLEARYFLNSTSSAYALVCGFGNLGIRYGDSGFADRLQAATSFASLPTCYTTPYTRANTYQNIVTFKLERKSNITKLYFNGAQINFSTGTGTSYTNSQISDNINVSAYNIISLSSQAIALINFTLNF